jgi:hypothetical protein
MWLMSIVRDSIESALVEPSPFIWDVERWWASMHVCSHLCVHREPCAPPPPPPPTAADDSCARCAPPT